MLFLFIIALVLILIFGFWNVLGAIIGIPIMIGLVAALLFGGVVLIALVAKWAEEASKKKD